MAALLSVDWLEYLRRGDESSCSALAHVFACERCERCKCGAVARVKDKE